MFFGVIGKVLKCRCLKWPRIGHLDIWSPSYGQKKGQESNWQFDSRPLKVKNRPAPDVRWGSATRHWKAFEEGYKFGLNLVPIGGQGEKLGCPKVPGVQNRDSFGTPILGVPKKSAIRVQVRRRGTKNTIGRMVVAPLEPGPRCVMLIRISPWLVPTLNACIMSSNQLMLVLDAGSWPNSLISS